MNGRRGLTALVVLALLLIGAPAPSAAQDGEAAAADEGPFIGPGTVVFHETTGPLGGPATSQCTLNFVFRDASAPQETADLYIGTAAHCADEVGASSSTRDIEDFGEVVYRPGAYAPDTVAADFALIKVHDAWKDHVQPAMKVYGGPTGEAAEPSFGTPTFLYGHGVGAHVTEPTRPRAGVFGYTVMGGPYEGYFGAFNPVVQGDSGAPVIDQHGRAIGTVAHIRAGVDAGGTFEGPTIQRIFHDLNEAGLDVELVTAPATTPTEDPGMWTLRYALGLYDQCVRRPAWMSGCVTA